MSNADWGAATDTGLHRARNEDNYLAGPTLFAVADGMGGHVGGDIASDLAIGVLRELGDADSLTTEDLQTAIRTAHEEIVAHGQKDSSLLGLGTTVAGVAMVTLGGTSHWAVFNVGDSRVYRRLGDTLTQVSIDHSEVEELIASGRLDREQARTDYRRNIITRSLGADARPIADMWVFPPTPGEQFLICSDGLTDELDDMQILNLLRAAATPRDAAHLLVTAAVRAGGHDNVTAVVVATSLDDSGSDSDSEVDEDTNPHVGAGR